uniref:C-type lectin domain-containing protein n=1 Tax=Dicentrarchus labrax TaxID=13489 RepID=A0A8P4K582_DICLA
CLYCMFISFSLPEINPSQTLTKKPGITFSLTNQLQENKTWEEALYHCRDNEMDLASILDDEDQAWAELQARDADTDHVWLGLHYTCILQFWFWVDDNRLDFSRLDQESKKEECDTSVVMEKKEEHLWFSKSDYDEFNFISFNMYF